MNFPPVRAVLFDAYGTLFNVHAPMAKLADEIGPDAGSISDLWRAKQLQYTWLRSLMGVHADFEQITAGALDFALGQYGRDTPELRDRLLSLYFTLDAYPDAISALSALRQQGIVTGILSNGSPSMLGKAVNSAGLGALLDHVLSVEEVGIYKPHPSVYRFGQERVGSAPGEIGFVSANGWDAHGAAQFGFAVIHLHRTPQTAERLPGKPLQIVQNLDEILPLLSQSG